MHTLPFSFSKIQHLAIILSTTAILGACHNAPLIHETSPNTRFSQQHIAELKKVGFVQDEITGDWNLNLDGQILFDTNEYTLKPQGIELIEQIIRVLQLVQINALVVEGHADSTGSPQQNLALSAQRAQAVAQTIAQLGGPPYENITRNAFGDTRPVADNKTAEGRAQNRRVTLIVIAGS